NTKIKLVTQFSKFKHRIYLIKRISNFKLKTIITKHKDFLLKLYKKSIYYNLVNYNKKLKLIFKRKLNKLIYVKKLIIKKLILLNNFKLCKKFLKLKKLKNCIKQRIKNLITVFGLKFSILNLNLKWKISN